MTAERKVPGRDSGVSSAAAISDPEVTAPPMQSRESLMRQRDDWHAAWMEESRKRRRFEAALTEIRMLTVEVGDSVEAATRACDVAMEALGE